MKNSIIAIFVILAIWLIFTACVFLFMADDKEAIYIDSNMAVANNDR